MPVSCFENAIPVGTPSNGCAWYAFVNFAPSTFAVATRWPRPLSVTVTVTCAL